MLLDSKYLFFYKDDMNAGNNKKNILIVDDRPKTLRGLIKYLGESGIRVSIAQSGEEMLSLVDHNRPELILLDVMMPGMDGFESCRRLKKQTAFQTIPVIFITALTDTVDKVKGFEAGGVDYIVKPFQFKEVLARVRTHLTIRTLQNELHQQSERFRGLAGATFEGILFFENGLVVELNQSLEAMFGYARDDLIGKPGMDLLMPGSSERLFQSISDTGQTKPFEAVGLRKDQSTFPVECQAKIMRYQQRDVYVIAIRDVSWRKALEKEKTLLQNEIVTLKSTVANRYSFSGIIGKSVAMQQVYELILKAAASDANVLVYGESGTGKDLVAQNIHKMSDRKDKAFVAVNCGGIPETLFESEFFGHRKGSFSGAIQDKRGFFDAAQGGTLFLDEIGELTLPMQTKLLRAIEGKGYMPVGGNTAKQADVRVIAATNRDLEKMVGQGTFRDDLYYRIYVIVIPIPPLRERKEDLPLLVAHFLERFGHDDPTRALSGDTFEELYTRDWPGNIRELQNVLQRYLTLQQFDVPGHSPQKVLKTSEMTQILECIQAGEDFEAAIIRFQKQLILNALEYNRWHKGNTAGMLGMNRKALYRKMKRLELL